MRSKASPAVILLFFTFQLAALGFSSNSGAGGDIHAEITREALSDLMSAANLKVIIDVNQAQDSPGSAELSELRRHFGDERFASSLGYIDREKKRALNYALEADTDPEQRGRALTHFGEMLHCVQDFYSRSNYLELMLEKASNQEDPYAIPLVDWQKVPDGYPGLVSANPNTAGPDRVGLLKDSLLSEGGKKILSGKTTYFSVAKYLAVRETQRQWTLFETMIKNRCGSRAAAILAAIKQASPVIKTNQEQEL